MKLSDAQITRVLTIMYIFYAHTLTHTHTKGTVGEVGGGVCERRQMPELGVHSLSDRTDRHQSSHSGLVIPAQGRGQVRDNRYVSLCH